MYHGLVLFTGSWYIIFILNTLLSLGISPNYPKILNRRGGMPIEGSFMDL